MANRNKPPYFNRDTIPLSELYYHVGRRPERPFMILATLLETSLGDLLSKIVFLSTLKDQFDHARLIVRYADNRPYTTEAVSLSPNIDHATPIRGTWPKWLIERFPDPRPWWPLGRWSLGGEKMQDAFYDLVVVDTMMDIRNVYGFDRTVPLRIPPDRADALHRQLIGAGLDPTRWYATMHYRTASYGHKLNKSPIRNSDPENYRQLADYIIDELGGQVIQLGHPEMQAFPPRRGFVDLSRIANAFMLQAYAVSRSRFLIAGPSGPIGIGWSFHVPTALVDATDSLNGWGDGRHLLLTHEVTTPEGQALRNRALYDAGLLDYVVLKQKLKAGLNYRIRKSSPGELAEAARALFERTSDVQGLRALPQHHGGPKPNQLVWPPQPRISPRFLGE